MTAQLSAYHRSPPAAASRTVPPLGLRGEHGTASRRVQPVAHQTTRPHVIVIADGNAAAHHALEAALLPSGLVARCYGSAAALLAAGAGQEVGCILVDAGLPTDCGREGGLELQRTLAARGVKTPVIIMSDRADVAVAVRAMRSGAINFLVKPCAPKDLLAAIHEAIEIEAARQTEQRATARLRQLATTLTPREVEVLMAVDRGLMNKQIAGELGISLITVKMHRSNAFKKLGATSATDMVQKVRDLNLVGRPKQAANEQPPPCATIELAGMAVRLRAIPGAQRRLP